jgi:AcrR family transcriptional regulator
MTRRAPRSAGSLSVDSIVEFALRLIDREGLEALSMRRLGAELGVEAMALYHHFPNKQALIEAIMTRGSPGELPEPTGNFRADMVTLMQAVYEQLAAHPALFPLRWSRREHGPEAKAILSREQAIFERAGFPADLCRDAHRLLGGYLVGMVVAWGQARRAIPASAWRAQFETGLEMILDGIAIRHRRETGRRR